MSSGTLYITSTPIGNIKDITIRALEVLSKVKFIVCEDTRRTGNLLNLLQKSHNLQIKAVKYISYFEGNERNKTPYLLSLLESGNDLALVSDGGTPLISDPGYLLVLECISKKIPVEAIPGPSALITALTLSGLPNDHFLFLGYSPKKSNKRIKFFLLAKQIFSTTIIFYESPHRVLESLSDLRTALGDLEIVVCRELTKVFQEVSKNKVSFFEKLYSGDAPKGEFTILFRV